MGTAKEVRMSEDAHSTHLDPPDPWEVQGGEGLPCLPLCSVSVCLCLPYVGEGWQLNWNFALLEKESEIFIGFKTQRLQFWFKVWIGSWSSSVVCLFPNFCKTNLLFCLLIVLVNSALSLCQEFSFAYQAFSLLHNTFDYVFKYFDLKLDFRRAEKTTSAATLVFSKYKILACYLSKLVVQ